MNHAPERLSPLNSVLSVHIYTACFHLSGNRKCTSVPGLIPPYLPVPLYPKRFGRQLSVLGRCLPHNCNTPSILLCFSFFFPLSSHIPEKPSTNTSSARVQAVVDVSTSAKPCRMPAGRMEAQHLPQSACGLSLGQPDMHVCVVQRRDCAGAGFNGKIKQTNFFSKQLIMVNDGGNEALSTSMLRAN